jgi:hypothetical protein
VLGLQLRLAASSRQPAELLTCTAKPTSTSNHPQPTPPYPPHHSTSRDRSITKKASNAFVDFWKKPPCESPKDAKCSVYNKPVGPYEWWVLYTITVRAEMQSSVCTAKGKVSITAATCASAVQVQLDPVALAPAVTGCRYENCKVGRVGCVPCWVFQTGALQWLGACRYSA